MIQAARSAFPAGLEQPKSGFRFGIDSLLLACFAPCRSGDRVLDLGTGCGVVGLGLCLAHEEKKPQVLGVEVQEELLCAAGRNAKRLGLEDRYSACTGNVCQYREIADVQAGGFDLIVCNPPYRPKHQGRHPQDPGRRQACFEHYAGVQDFLQAASYALANKGRLSLVYLAERLPFLLHQFQAYRLQAKEMRLVHSTAAAQAKLVLITARKNVRPGLAVHAPLFLDQDKDMAIFCPLWGKKRFTGLIESETVV
jgi:tRNA1Val (adenine37-N6)-methyltransferase